MLTTLVQYPDLGSTYVPPVRDETDLWYRRL